MSNVDNVIQDIELMDDRELLRHDFAPCFRLIREMEDAMVEFVERVERGEVHSRYTYNQFNAILGRRGING